MRSNIATVEVQLVFKNKRAAKALGRATALIEEMADDFPYRPEMRKAVKAMRYALKNIEARAAT